MITEDQLERLCLDWFKTIGYETICGYDIASDGDNPERTDYPPDWLKTWSRILKPVSL